MKAGELIALFERMLAERWAYEWGAAREGCVDCSGAFVYAFKKYGQSIAHGSNTIARAHVMGGMRPAGEAKPGWAVFKRRFDAQEPDKYKQDGLGNLYHIGLLAADGKRVLNAKGERYGFCAEALSGWSLAAPLSGVAYEEDEEMNALYQAVVTTEKDPLRVREAPVTGEVLGHVPKGERVDVLAEGDMLGASGWSRVRYGELVGYASGAYLWRVGVPDGGAGDADGGVSAEQGEEAVRIPRALAQQLYRTLGEALSVD